MRRVIAAVNNDDTEQLRNDLTEDVVHHTTDAAYEGRDTVIEFYRMLREQAGWVITPHAFATTDEWGSVIHRNTFNDGTFEVTTSGRIRDGRIAELWTVGLPSADDAG